MTPVNRAYVKVIVNFFKEQFCCTYVLDNEAIELEFISVLIYYTYIRKLEREKSMMCRNDKSRVGPKRKTQHLPPVPKQHEGKQNIK